MEDDEAVKEVVVLLDGRGHVGPVAGGDGRGVEEGVKLQDAVADVALVRRGRRAERVDGDELSLFVRLKLDWISMISELQRVRVAWC